MYSLKEAVIVEGKYDVIKLSNIINTIIISTDGFSIFTDDKKMGMIKRLAAEQGIIILTDSDRAGFLIRNYICGCIPANQIKHAYIPQIIGVEKRKVRSSKEGFLGVEGVAEQAILKALESACAVKKEHTDNKKFISKLDLYNDGLIGKENSRESRMKIMENISLPTRLSVKALIKIFNALYTYDEYKTLVTMLNNKQN